MINPAPRWPMFRKVWRREKLIERMIGEMGIDQVVAARLDRGDAYSEASAKCLACSAQSECRSWLEASDGLPLPPDICPNDEFFKRCLERQKNKH
jgi:hypothetical protein